jgi:hypothetical protein
MSDEQDAKDRDEMYLGAVAIEAWDQVGEEITRLTKERDAWQAVARNLAQVLELAALDAEVFSTTSARILEIQQDYTTAFIRQCAAHGVKP